MRAKRIAVPLTSTRSVEAWISPIASSDRGVSVSETSEATGIPSDRRRASGWFGPICAISPSSIPPDPVTGFCILPRSRTMRAICWRSGSPVSASACRSWRNEAESIESARTETASSFSSARGVASSRRASWGRTPGGSSERWRPKGCGTIGPYGYGTSATMRSGPPEPPAIFIGRAMTHAPHSGSASRLATFSRPGTLAPLATTCTRKSFDAP